MNNRVLQLDPRDNVLIALTNLRKGERVTFGDQSYVLGSDVRAKHKFATQDFPTGAEIIMYGLLVGEASC
jgi:altronate hydrolase